MAASADGDAESDSDVAAAWNCCLVQALRAFRKSFVLARGRWRPMAVAGGF
jgi:hypothetical protein